MTWSYVLLTVADVALTVFVIFPLSILHWRGTWQLQEVYISPSDFKLSCWVSFAIGANLCIVELLIQPWLKETLSTSSKCTYIVVSRLHLYIHGWAVLCYWRGLWELLDDFGGKGWVLAVILYVIAQSTLILAKTVRTAIGIPVSLRLDTSPDLLDSDLVFKTNVSIITAVSLISSSMRIRQIGVTVFRVYVLVQEFLLLSPLRFSTIW